MWKSSLTFSIEKFIIQYDALLKTNLLSQISHDVQNAEYTVCLGV